MSTALVIATREIRERSRLFIVAAALALIPFVVAMLSESRDRDEVIRLVGAAAAVNYALVVALAMGASTIGRDLSEKRLSFYFSKPVSPTALWIGKASASLWIALLCALIVALPSLLLSSPSQSSWVPRLPTFALFTVLASLACFFGGHAVSTMTRSRSILLLLDFLFAGALLGIAFLILRPVLLAGGVEVAGVLGSILLGGVLLILAVAPVWQLDRGRTDLRRSHGALSQFLWSGVAILLVLVGAGVLWLRSAKPSDLTDVSQIEHAPAGGWAMVSGVSANRGDFHSAFLMNAKSGEQRRLAAPPFSEVAWSRDGRVAAWMQPVGVRMQEFELYVWEAGSDRSRATGITGPFWSGVALSDDGSRVALVKSDSVAVHDLQKDRLLVAAHIDSGARAQLFFTSRDLVRILQYDRDGADHLARVRSSELDVLKRSITRTGEREKVGVRAISYSADGSRAFIRTTGEIVDGRTLAPIVKIATNSRSAALLHDGHVAVVEKDAGVRVRLFDPQGRPLSVVELPNVTNAYLVAETTDGKLLLSGGTPADRGIFVIDRARGVLDRSIPHVSSRVAGWKTDPRMPRYEAGQSFIGTDSTRKLKVWS
jgi:hypothetical protein